MPKKMMTTVKVRNHHLDGYGHVNNARYFTYLEDARTDFFEELGLTMQMLRERNIQIVLTDLTAKFRYPAKLGDVLQVYGWFIDIARRKATWWHEIYEQSSGKLVLTGTATGMFLEHGKVTVIPADIREVMEQLYFPENDTRPPSITRL